AWSSARTSSADNGLPRYAPVLCRRRNRHDASCLFFGRTGDAYGARRILLGRGSHSPYHPDPGSLEFPPTGRAARSEIANPVPSLLGSNVSGIGRFLELPRCGIFGFLINLPIVSYYEIGTALTANHGHASMMGVYGMFSVGLALFCQRYMIP